MSAVCIHPTSSTNDLIASDQPSHSSPVQSTSAYSSPSAPAASRWCGHCWHRSLQLPSEKETSDQGEQSQEIGKSPKSRECSLQRKSGLLTASISSSSSSIVETVTELNLPMFFVCLVTMIWKKEKVSPRLRVSSLASYTENMYMYRWESQHRGKDSGQYSQRTGWHNQKPICTQHLEQRKEVQLLPAVKHELVRLGK